MADVPEDLRSPKELAKLLNVTASTVRHWIRTGRLPGYRVVGRWRASEAIARALEREYRPPEGGKPPEGKAG